MPPVFFDVETDGLPPCNITVACTLHDGVVKNWVSRDEAGKAVAMTPATATALAEYLDEVSDSGGTLVTYNGAKFDLQLLHDLVETPETKALVATLARAHVDLMLSCALRLGYYTSMDSLAKGSLDSRSKTGTGLQAVKWWKSNKIDELLEYCGSDCRVLEELHAKAAEKQMLYRLPKNGGSRKAVDVSGALVPVAKLVLETPHREDWMRPNANILTTTIEWLPRDTKRLKSSP